MKFSVYWKRHVFVMRKAKTIYPQPPNIIEYTRRRIKPICPFPGSVVSRVHQYYLIFALKTSWYKSITASFILIKINWPSGRGGVKRIIKSQVSLTRVAYEKQPSHLTCDSCLRLHAYRMGLSGSLLFSVHKTGF